MPAYRLISFILCPYVQRSVITLEEKGISYEIEHIDLSNKPQWFLDISPRGKVPVLQVDGDTALFESAVINEYLDETAGAALLPTDPLARAYERAWIVVADDVLTALNGLTAAMDEEAARAKATTLGQRLDKLEEHLGEGPFWRGEGFSLMDSAAAPGLQRLHWVDRYAPELGLLEGRPKVRRWIEALLERPAVVNSTVPDIEARYIKMIGRDRGQPGLHSWLGQRALDFSSAA